MEIKKDLEELKKYVKSYITRNYGEKCNYIRGMKTSKNGLFIYGHKAYAPGYGIKYKIHTYISWYEVNNYSFINDLLDTFVLDCQRLKEEKVRGILSEKARKNKIAYNMKRNKELYGKFQALIPKEEYNQLCEYLQSIGMNKAEFIRWAFDKLRED